MANQRMLEFTKVWNDKSGNYGEKQYLFNPEFEMKGIEPCRINNNGKEVECTKIFYETGFLILAGSIESFISKCRESNIAVCLLMDLDRQGITVKNFLKQIEGFNNVELM